MLFPSAFLAPLALAAPAALEPEDFSFSGPLGSQGTTISQLGTNHFRVVLGAAPAHPEWNNKLQFTILRHAAGNAPRLDVEFGGGPDMALNEYHGSYSYDGVTWHPVHWAQGYRRSPTKDTMQFPTFQHDRVVVGHQVPMSYEDSQALIARWSQSPLVTVHEVGRSLEGRAIQRVEVTDAASDVPRSARWVHYFANQHPGEHNSQWRLAGIMDWLLSDEAADFRRRSIVHVILFMSPDAPSHGWYRVNGQGVDMNRSYRAAGADPSQAHEAWLCQRDLEALMASEAPVTTVWGMHTWGGIVEPIVSPGPELGTRVGPWEQWRDTMVGLDSRHLIKPLAARVDQSPIGPVSWTGGPHRQFGVTAILCEGAGAIDNQADNLASGRVIIRALAEHYRGTRR